MVFSDGLDQLFIQNHYDMSSFLIVWSTALINNPLPQIDKQLLKILMWALTHRKQKWCFPKIKTVINAKAVKYSLPVCLILTQPNDLNVKSIAFLNK